MISSLPPRPSIVKFAVEPEQSIVSLPSVPVIALPEMETPELTVQDTCGVKATTFQPRLLSPPPKNIQAAVPSTETLSTRRQIFQSPF